MPLRSADPLELGVLEQTLSSADPLELGVLDQTLVLCICIRRPLETRRVGTNLCTDNTAFVSADPLKLGVLEQTFPLGGHSAIQN